eukprot:8833989-Prorocentrum_lima.AAC.1
MRAAKLPMSASISKTIFQRARTRRAFLPTRSAPSSSANMIFQRARSRRAFLPTSSAPFSSARTST